LKKNNLFIINIINKLRKYLIIKNNLLSHLHILKKMLLNIKKLLLKNIILYLNLEKAFLLAILSLNLFYNPLKFNKFKIITHKNQLLMLISSTLNHTMIFKYKLYLSLTLQLSTWHPRNHKNHQRRISLSRNY
jgi:hypothetical protein